MKAAKRRRLEKLEEALEAFAQAFGGDASETGGFPDLIMNGDGFTTRLSDTPHWPEDEDDGGEVMAWRVWWMLRNLRVIAEQELARAEMHVA